MNTRHLFTESIMFRNLMKLTMSLIKVVILIQWCNKKTNDCILDHEKWHQKLTAINQNVLKDIKKSYENIHFVAKLYFIEFHMSCHSTTVYTLKQKVPIILTLIDTLEVSKQSLIKMNKSCFCKKIFYTVWLKVWTFFIKLSLVIYVMYGQ